MNEIKKIVERPAMVKDCLLSKLRLRPIKIILVILLVHFTSQFFHTTKINSSSYLTQKQPDNALCQPNVIGLQFDNWKHTALNTQHPSCNATSFLHIKSDGSVRFQKGVVQCKYQAITWSGDDFSYSMGGPIRLENGQKLNRSVEFFKVDCDRLADRKRHIDGKVSGYFARIFKSKKPTKRTEQGKEEKQRHPLNVMMLSLDSVSRKKWLTQLPRSSEFLLKELGTNILTGFNIAGDGTPASLIPMLTGKHEEELPNTLKNVANSVEVDKAYPFVWQNFSDVLDYATMYNEDWPHVGCFQYRMKGFSKPPTTHYPRPFQLALPKHRSFICDHGRSIFDVNLDYTRDFMHIYKHTGFFGMSHIKQYTHDEGLNDIRWLDESLYKFLRDFKADPELSGSTVLFVLSDHGQRYAKNRKSVQGLLDERNPFHSVYLPDLFRQRYPAEYKSLKANVDRVVAPMDIHATLLDLIRLEKTHINNDKSSLKERAQKMKTENTERGSSLFIPLSPKRTCKDAGIASYWCGCLRRTPIPIDANILQLANSFTSYLNNVILKDHLDLCHPLELYTINSVFKVSSYIDPHRAQTKTKQFKKLNLLQAPKIEKNFEKYLFQVRTKPNNGVYEFSIVLESTIDNKTTGQSQVGKIDRKFISRINKYGSVEHCIHDKFPDLRKYCYCR